MDEKIRVRLRELITIAHLAYEKNFTSGSGGNVSLRCDGTWYVSATGSYFGSLTEEDFSCMDFQGNVLSGRAPSKEAVMHLECYRRRTDISCIIHLHPVHSIAVTCLKHVDSACGMPIYTPGYALRVHEIPVVPYYKPGSRRLAMAVAAEIEKRDSLLLKNHGLLVVGKTAQGAFGLAEEIEENAHIALLLGERGVPMTGEQIEEMGYSGGTL